MVSRRAQNRCEYCHAPEIITNFSFEVEHIQASSLQGTSTEDNLALACRACNLFKSNTLFALDPETNTEVRLFHPRIDIWEEHFRVDAPHYDIVGITPTGRATVRRLQMNSDFQVSARLLWVRVGLFP
jgi:hypothetical protein